MKSIIGLVTMTLVISAWVGAGLFYHELPSLMPTHWSTPFDRANGFLAAAIPVSISLVITGSVMPHEMDWFRTRPFAGTGDGDRRPRAPGARGVRPVMS